MKRILSKLASMLPALAMVAGILAVNSACSIYYHQPETPSAMDAFRK